MSTTDAPSTSRATTATPSAQALARLLETPNPRPLGPVAASMAMGRRALIKLYRVPEQLGDIIGIPVLFTVFFTYLFGGALAGSTSAYLRDLLPGTLVMALLLVTQFAGSTLNEDKQRGVLDRYRSRPVWQPSLIVGNLIGDIGRYVFASALVLGLGFLMGFRADGGVVGVLAAAGLAIVAAFGYSWIWTTVGLLLRTPAAVQMAGFVIPFPLVFASNVFVDPSTMPGWLESFVNANPVSGLVATVRELAHGTADLADVGVVIAVSAALVAVFGPITMRLYRSRT